MKVGGEHGARQRSAQVTQVSEERKRMGQISHRAAAVCIMTPCLGEVTEVSAWDESGTFSPLN